MTPQERELISQLFDRLSRLESQPRDPDAERAIQEGLQRAPHATYALVQTVLVQDEALKTANARIEQLQAAVGRSDDQGRPAGGFLDNMRNALFGTQDQRQGSVPPVGSRPNYAPPPQPNYAPPPNYAPSGFGQRGGYEPPPSGGSGPSFLGTAAAAAAGVVGGSLLLGGIRSMLGGSGHGAFAGTFDSLGGGYGGGGPVEVIDEYGPGSDAPGGGGRDSLAESAGYDDVGRDADYADTGRDADYADAGRDDSYDNGGSNDDYA
jgi:hypothetical protein